MHSKTGCLASAQSCGARTRLSAGSAIATRTCAEYRLVAKKGEGTFSEVLKAQCIKNSKYVAIKCMKNHFDSLEQVLNTSRTDAHDQSRACKLEAMARRCSLCR